MAQSIARPPSRRAPRLPAIVLALLLAACGAGGDTANDSAVGPTAPADGPSQPDDSDAGTGGDTAPGDETDPPGDDPGPGGDPGTDPDDTDPPTGAIDTLIELSWMHSLDPVEGYIVYRGPTRDAVPTRFVERSRAALDPQAPSIVFNAGTDLGLQPGDSVCFWLSAYIDDRESELSAPECADI